MIHSLESKTKEVEEAEEEKEEDMVGLVLVVFVSSGNEESKKLCFDFFQFPRDYAGMCFSKDQYSDQVEYGINWKSFLGWRKYL